MVLTMFRHTDFDPQCSTVRSKPESPPRPAVGIRGTRTLLSNSSIRVKMRLCTRRGLPEKLMLSIESVQSTAAKRLVPSHMSRGQASDTHQLRLPKS